MNKLSVESNVEILLPEQKTGHIYIFDCEEKQGFLLSAILLHDVPFYVGKDAALHNTSLVQLKISDPDLYRYAGAIFHALSNSELIHAEVIFQSLRLLPGRHNGIPNTAADLMQIVEIIVKYRGSCES